MPFRRQRPSRPKQPARRPSFIESLEPRTLMSESASAQLHLLSTTGTAQNPVYNYDLTLTNTGTTPLGTFWFAWVPSGDLLPVVPSNPKNPANWSDTVLGSGNALDGASIQWVANSPGAALAPGQSLGGFDFSSTDSPAILAAAAPAHPAFKALTSFVYGGGPFSDTGAQFDVAPVPAGAAPSITSLAPSATSANAGDNLTFTALVAPATPGGAAPTGTVTFSDGATPLGSAPVQSDGTASFSTAALAVGDHSITAAYAGDATYAASTSAPVGVTVTAAPAQPALTVTVTRSTLPASVIAGAPAHGVVTVGVTNASASPVKGPVTIDLFASANGAIDNASVPVAHLTRTLAIQPGKTLPVPLPIKSLPATLPNGQYTLLARVTDPSSLVSDSTTGPQITVAAPFIALSETFAKLTLPASVAAGAKLHAVASVKITNTGNDTASGPTTVAIFLSTDGAIDNTATPIKSLTKSLKIKPGKSVVVSVPLTQLPALAPGNYVVAAQITDPQQRVTSVASSTNITVAG